MGSVSVVHMLYTSIQKDYHSKGDQWFPTWGAPEFTAGVREQIYFEVGLGDKMVSIIIFLDKTSSINIQFNVYAAKAEQNSATHLNRSTRTISAQFKQRRSAERAD